MTLKNLFLDRKQQKPIVFDLFFNNNNKKKPLVIFCHGYKGFKDWGAWDLVAKSFKSEGLFFVKFNFSHNGGTIKQPIDFPDLEAFANNNYTKELEDLEDMITYLTSSDNPYIEELDTNNITLIGHSRGGGIATLKASNNQKITTLITLAGVSEFEKRTSKIANIKQWKNDGVSYVLNGRTKQKMPHNYQLYQDTIENTERLNIQKACQQITIPHLIIHAKDDPSVKYKEAQALHTWNPNSMLYNIKNSDHVFGAKHPWDDDLMPLALKKVTKKCLFFITKKGMIV